MRDGSGAAREALLLQREFFIREGASCLKYGVAEPVIRVSTDWVTVTFPRREGAIAPMLDDSLQPCREP